MKATVLLAANAATDCSGGAPGETPPPKTLFGAGPPPSHPPPQRAALDAWTRAHGTGFVIGDLEWDQFYGLSVADYHTGIHVVKGQRVNFTGSFQQAQIRRTDTALLLDALDPPWGRSFAAST